MTITNSCKITLQHCHKKCYTSCTYSDSSLSVSRGSRRFEWM